MKAILSAVEFWPLQNSSQIVVPFRVRIIYNDGARYGLGEMAERSNATVLKTVEAQVSGGSNPSLPVWYCHCRAPICTSVCTLRSVTDMSWSLEIYTSSDERPSAEIMSLHLEQVAPFLVVCDTPAPTADRFAVCDRAGDALLTVQTTSFADECAEDPELTEVLSREIAESDAGEIDDDFSARLTQMLRGARWHITLAARRNDVREQEIAVVSATYAASRIAPCLVHDLQSGAWMDSALFEEMLEAYDANSFG